MLFWLEWRGWFHDWLLYYKHYRCRESQTWKWTWCYSSYWDRSFSIFKWAALLFSSPRSLQSVCSYLLSKRPQLPLWFPFSSYPSFQHKCTPTLSWYLGCRNLYFSWYLFLNSGRTTSSLVFELEDACRFIANLYVFEGYLSGSVQWNREK